MPLPRGVNYRRFSRRSTSTPAGPPARRPARVSRGVLDPARPPAGAQLSSGGPRRISRGGCYASSRARRPSGWGRPRTVRRGLARAGRTGSDCARRRTSARYLRGRSGKRRRRGHDIVSAGDEDPSSAKGVQDEADVLVTNAHAQSRGRRPDREEIDEVLQEATSRRPPFSARAAASRPAPASARNRLPISSDTRSSFGSRLVIAGPPRAETCLRSRRPLPQRLRPRPGSARVSPEIKRAGPAHAGPWPARTRTRRFRPIHAPLDVVPLRRSRCGSGGASSSMTTGVADGRQRPYGVMVVSTDHHALASLTRSPMRTLHVRADRRPHDGDAVADLDESFRPVTRCEATATVELNPSRS